MTVYLLTQLSEAYVLDAGLWSLAGFSGGYVVGRLHYRHLLRKKDRRDRTS